MSGRMAVNDSFTRQHQLFKRKKRSNNSLSQDLCAKFSGKKEGKTEERRRNKPILTMTAKTRRLNRGATWWRKELLTIYMSLHKGSK